MASLFGNQNRVKLVDEEDGMQRNTTRLGSLLKPNRIRLLDSRLHKDDSMTSFDNESLFSSGDGSGDADSLAPQASIARNCRPLHLPQSSSVSVGSSSIDSVRALASIREPETSLRSRRPPLSSGVSSQSSKSLFTDVERRDTTTHSKFQQSATSFSFFDPDSSRTSFFQNDEADDIEGSSRPTVKQTHDGFPASRSISKDINFGSFQSEEEEADDIISPVPASPFTKPKIGSTRNSISSLKFRTADFSLEDMKVLSTPSDRSYSRRSLPSNLARSFSDSPGAVSTSRSMRQNHRTSLTATFSDSAKTPTGSSSAAIDMSKASEVAREKLKNLRAHRSTTQMASLRRSSNRDNSIKDRKTINGVLSNILGENDDAFNVSPTSADSSCRMHRTPSTSSKKPHRYILQGDLPLNDVDFPEPYFSPTGSKKKVKSSECKKMSSFPEPSFSPTGSKKKVGSGEDTEKRSKGIRTVENDENERSTRGSLRGSSRRASRSLDKHIKHDSVNSSELTAPSTPDSSMKDSVGGKSKSSRGRRSLGGDEAVDGLSSRKSRTSGKITKSSETDFTDFNALTSAAAKSAAPVPEAEAAEDNQSSRKLRTTGRHQKPPTKEPESKKNSDNSFGPGFADFAETSTTPKAAKVVDKFNSGFTDFALSTPNKSQNLGFEDSFGSFKSQNPSLTAPKHGATKPSVREQAKVEPKIVPARMSVVIPKHLKHSINKDDSMDNSGHTYSTKATNWNWEDDNWGGQPEANHPTTINEEDEDQDDAFGSPTIHLRKSLNSSVQRQSSSFSLTTPGLVGFVGNGNGAHTMDRSVASAPFDHSFNNTSSTSRELPVHRASTGGRPQRRTVRPHRSSDPFS